jgi:site-specific DNA recombinase
MMAAIRRLRARPEGLSRRAIALIRVSKERDGMTSPDVQRHAIDTYAAANRISIIDYVEGIDESGSRAKSAWWPKLTAALDRIEAGDADDILVWKYSRTARNRLKWNVALDRIDTLGGMIVSVTEPIESNTASGKFARGMLGEMNAYHADLIGEGWKETLDRRVRNGLPGTGRPRFGYRWEPGSDYTVDPAVAATVREMYARSLAGHGMASIARWLNSEGHRTRNGLEWQVMGVTRYMDRGFAAGFIWSKGVLHEGAHEAIIPTPVWNAYIKRRATTPRFPSGGVRMLSGLLKCGSCGAPMMANTTRRGSSGSYGCARSPRGGHCPRPVSISRHIAERLLCEWVAKLCIDAGTLRAAGERELERWVTSIEDRAAISRLIQRAEERLARITILYADDKLSDAAYKSAAGSLNADLAALKVRLNNAAPLPKPDLLDRVPRLVEGWADRDPESQNRIAKQLVARIVVQPGRDVKRVHIVARWDEDHE